MPTGPQILYTLQTLCLDRRLLWPALFIEFIRVLIVELVFFFMFHSPQRYQFPYNHKCSTIMLIEWVSYFASNIWCPVSLPGQVHYKTVAKLCDCIMCISVDEFKALIRLYNIDR